MKVVELLRTILFLPTWIGSAWAMHIWWGWWWLATLPIGLVLSVVVCIATTLVYDHLTA